MRLSFFATQEALNCWKDSVNLANIGARIMETPTINRLHLLSCKKVANSSHSSVFLTIFMLEAEKQTLIKKNHEASDFQNKVSSCQIHIRKLTKVSDFQMKALRPVSFRNKPFYVSDFDLNFFVWSDIEIFVFQKIKFWDQIFLTN